MLKNQGPVYYPEYLHLKEFLGAQTPLSRKAGAECHDEMLFIVVHQAFELWFKQILHELKSVNAVFASTFVHESALFTVQAQLDRILKIQTLFIQQLDVLETMTPMDFLEFRELLMPASGFQSLQFREIEIRLGLSTSERASVDRNYFLGRLSDEDRKHIESVEKELPLIKALEKWLERMPFTNTGNFKFWQAYQGAVQKMLDSDKKWIESNATRLSETEKRIQIENARLTAESFSNLFDEKKYLEAQKLGLFKLSQKALLNALFIFLYRDEPLLSAPYHILNSLITMDENFTSWRFKHALMAQRMIGKKIGTGGSSGHQYLSKATDTNRVFVDFFNLSTFLIPRSELPKIPDDIRKQLQFQG